MNVDLRPIGLLLALVTLGGCASPLPAHDWRGPDRALKVMADRAASIGDISATCQVSLADPQGKTVTLEGAMAARGDKLLRLRAWKFNQAVLDLTMNEKGLFLWTGGRAAGRGEDLHLAHVAKAWLLMSGRIFAQPPAKVVDLGGPNFDLHYLSDGGTVVIEVERRTLTPRRYLLLDDHLRVRQVLTLDRYALVQGIPWAMRVRAQGDEGSVEVRLHNVEPRADLPEGAFTPPPGAVQQP